MCCGKLSSPHRISRDGMAGEAAQDSSGLDSSAMRYASWIRALQSLAEGTTNPQWVQISD